MKSIRQTVSAPVVILVAVLVAVIAYQAGATRTVAVAKPAVIATVNLPKVLEGLAQRSEAEAKLEALHAEFRQERDRREGALRQMAAEIETSEAPQELVDRIDLETVNLHAWRQFKFDKFDIEQALLFQDIYRNVKRTIRAMAESEGYDLVMFDTSAGELTLNPEARASRTDQIQQQILARSVLYASETLDITNDLIERMNNQFRAGQAAR